MNSFYPSIIADSLWEDLLDTSRVRIKSGLGRTEIPADLLKTEQGYLLSLYVPGVSRENIKISTKNHTLKVEVQEPKKDGKEVYLLREVAPRNRTREFAFKHDIEHSNIKATLDKGILSLDIEVGEVRAKLIEIST